MDQRARNQNEIQAIRSIRRPPRAGDVVGAGGARRNPMSYHDDIDEGPSEEDVERFGGATRTCPECGSEVYDDTVICPSCGYAFGAGPRRLPIWAIVAAALAIAGFILVQVVF